MASRIGDLALPDSATVLDAQREDRIDRMYGAPSWALNSARTDRQGGRREGAGRAATSPSFVSPVRVIAHHVRDASPRRRYGAGMSTQTDSPTLQRLAKILGWPEFPERTPEEAAEWAERKAQAERDRLAYYGDKALIPVTRERIRALHGM